jgi:hypothetical protein
LTELVNPSVAEAVAQVRDQLAAGTSCIVLSTPVGAGKSAILNALLSEPALLSSGRSVKRSIAELDQLHSDLDHGDGRIVICDADYVSSYVLSGRSDAAMAPTTSIVSSADTADHPWSSVVGSPAGSQLIPLDAGRRTPGDVGASVVCRPESHNVSSWLTFNEYLFPRLRRELLRLVNRLRIVLRLTLICVLSGLPRIPDAINFVLLLLAAVRCYGRRTEPSYLLPFLTSMSVVVGETVRLC